MKKFIFSLTILLLLLSSSLVHAQAMQKRVVLQSSYPSTFGIYSNLRLVPHDSPPACDSTKVGTFYYDLSESTFKYCDGSAPYVPLSSPWAQTGTNVHLVDNNNKVGIGTNTAEFKLTLDTDGGIMARGIFGSGAALTTTGAGTRFIWYPSKSALRAGTINGSQWDNASIGNYSVAFGQNNLAQESHSAILSGESNQITDPYRSDIASADHSVIGGGMTNIINGLFATIGGGKNNQILDPDGNGGNSNIYSSIGGGIGNIITGSSGTIAGGNSNRTYGYYATIAGGLQNIAGNPAETIWNLASFVGAGRLNKAMAIDSAIVGGIGNEIDPISTYSFIGGGTTNKINPIVNGPFGAYSVISGGDRNEAHGWASVIGGGSQNFVNQNTGTISGGQGNVINGPGAFIGGGTTNQANGQASVVSGGQVNIADGDYSVIAGGANNVAAGNYSWVGGSNMVLDAAGDNSFLWGHSGSPITPFAVASSFIIYSGNVLINPTGAAGQGNFAIGTQNPLARMHIIGEDINQPTLYIKSANGTGGKIIIEDNDGSGMCTEITTGSGDVQSRTVTCP